MNKEINMKQIKISTFLVTIIFTISVFISIIGEGIDRFVMIISSIIFFPMLVGGLRLIYLDYKNGKEEEKHEED